MEWNAEIEQRFTELRLKELSSNLTADETQELAHLMQSLAKADAETLSPVIAEIETKQARLEAELSELQSDNEALAHVLNQQKQLLVDAQIWLTEFEKRRQAIKEDYARLTGNSLAV